MRAVLVAFLACGACGAPGDAPPAKVHAEDRFTGDLSPAQDSDVVATVNGEELHAADVKRHAEARGLTARAALDELVAEELLAQEARRRGFLDDPEVIETRRRERVRRLIELAFAPTFDGPEDVTDDEVRRTYEHPQVHAFYNHDEYHVVSYARIPVERGKATAEQLARAKVVADKIFTAARAARPRTGDAFLELARAVSAAEGMPAELNPRYSLTRHATAVEEFAAPAFSIDTPGELAEPASTYWGWDVIYLDEIIPARRTPLAEAAAEIRQRRFESAREQAFLAWVGQLARGARIATADQVDELLAAIEVIAPVALP